MMRVFEGETRLVASRLGRMALAIGAVSILAACASIPRAGGYGATGGVVASAPPAPAPAPKPATPDWRSHFRDVSRGAILVSLDDRRLAYWSPGATQYREFPIAVPRSADLERRGRTSIVRRRRNPDWRPTPDMLRRNPNQPKYIGPGPHNPLGERALYLGWRYYAIHGTNNPLSIGEQATSGCFRMYPEHIEWLYEQARLGTPVRVVDGDPQMADRSLSLRALNDPTRLATMAYRSPAQPGRGPAASTPPTQSRAATPAPLSRAYGYASRN